MNTTERGLWPHLFLGFAAALLLTCSWEAPRDNPLDPSLGGNLDGRVLTRRGTGICGAQVVVPLAGRIVSTDSTGSFVLRGLPEGSVEVLLSADGHVAESTVLYLKKGAIDTLYVDLNGQPRFHECRVSAHVYGQSWPPAPRCFARFVARATDTDGDTDVDSAWVEIPTMGYSNRLTYDPDQGLLVHTFWASSGPGQSLETLVGRSVVFNVVDHEGAQAQSPIPGVSRIIYNMPAPLFPAGGSDTVVSDTTFIWRRFSHGYWVRYHCEVVRIEGGGPAGVAARFDTETPVDTTWLVAVSLLDSGDYYWTIEAIDEFGNSSRSAEELFHAR